MPEIEHISDTRTDRANMADRPITIRDRLRTITRGTEPGLQPRPRKIRHREMVALTDLDQPTITHTPPRRQIRPSERLIDRHTGSLNPDPTELSNHRVHLIDQTGRQLRRTRLTGRGHDTPERDQRRTLRLSGKARERVSVSHAPFRMQRPGKRPTVSHISRQICIVPTGHITRILETAQPCVRRHILYGQPDMTRCWRDPHAS